MCRGIVREESLCNKGTNSFRMINRVEGTRLYLGKIIY